MPVERASGGTSLIDVLDRVLDKGIVIDAWVRVSLVGIDLLTVEARVVVASIDTYIRYSEAVGAGPDRIAAAGDRGPDLRGLLAENASLRAQLAASTARSSRPRRRGKSSPARRRGRPASRKPWPASRHSTATPQVRGGIGSRGQAGAGRRPARRAGRAAVRRPGPALARPPRRASSGGLCAVVDERDGPADRPDRHRASLAAVDAFSLDLDDRTHPLVVALAGREPVAFHGSGGARACSSSGTRRSAPTPFHAVPLAGAGESGDVGPGLLLLTGVDAGRGRRRALGGRAAGRPAGRRSGTAAPRWTSGATSASGAGCSAIINAVTDPILLTDADGRILVANAGAEMLLTADDQKSEGRRRAVALNNMLFSASLFTTPERRRPTRQRAAAGRSDRGPGPAVRGAEHAGQDPRRARPASCRCCATSPTCAGPPRRSRRTTAGCASPRPRPAPSATGST